MLAISCKVISESVAKDTMALRGSLTRTSESNMSTKALMAGWKSKRFSVLIEKKNQKIENMPGISILAQSTSVESTAELV